MGSTHKCNIIYVEDDRKHRTIAAGLLSKRYGHNVIGYRDLATLRSDDESGHLAARMQPELPLVVLLDIMLAVDLGETQGSAPRWPREKTPDEGDLEHYVDDELGMKIAEDIRDNRFTSIPPLTPIVFVTARSNELVRERIAAIGTRAPAIWLGKPAFMEDLQEAIEQVLKHPHRRGRP